MDDPQDVGDAEYVFAVRLRLSPSDPTVRLDPATVETTLFKRAAPPGEDGWLFFRDNLWRGEVNDHGHMCELAEEMLGTDVESVDFRELRTDEAYYEELQDAIAEDLALFNADDVPEVLTKYMGSSIKVLRGE
ncbi:LWR-salt protein [Natronomonas gomsonensis]|jgi:hypothetical protein|uniref:LWR-salt protein n=1 Tax=Natronomonas gomsonensis TaxID=1046043 RepID=UPI0020CA9192|nr:LWR-salt protein [Natronomonas gomsonensis]MCY4731234.1 LWR-salt protein [Natronomonas gomsonensis]